MFKRVVRAIRGEPWSREEIQDLFQHSDNVFAPEEQEMLSGVLEVAETQVRDVMVPRAQMVVIGRDQSLDEMLQVIVESGHSRFPVIGEDRDEIVGILLAKDLLRFFSNPGESQLRLDRFIRPAVVIPESKRLNALLKEFRDTHNHMAIVVDEYGGVSGLLTIEDVLEEIVGEIGDEHDPAEDTFIQPEAERDGKPSYSVRALTRIEHFNEYFDAQLPDEDYDTVGGLVMAQLGRLPRRGDVVQFGDFEFRVTKADRRRVDTLLAQRLPVQDQ